MKVLTKLKETVDKQRDELRAIKRELQQKTVDCEAVRTRFWNFKYKILMLVTEITVVILVMFQALL